MPSASGVPRFEPSGELPRVATRCDRRDSNPHGLPHRILSPARLPVPPRSRDCPASTYVLLGRRGSIRLCRNCAVAPLNPGRHHRALHPPAEISEGGVFELVRPVSTPI